MLTVFRGSFADTRNSFIGLYEDKYPVPSCFFYSLPGEHNRVLTDHAADLCLAPTEVAMAHLLDEGLSERSVNVGDVMTDVCFRVRDMVSSLIPALPEGVDPLAPYLVATIHRPDNTDDPRRLQAVVDALAALPTPVVLMAHPRLVNRARSAGVNLTVGSLHMIDPLPYPQMVSTVMPARGVVTDSGGLQKEAFLLGTPCTTLRTETEWTETLEDGWNVLDPELVLVNTTADREAPTTKPAAPYGHGTAAQTTVQVLADRVLGR